MDIKAKKRGIWRIISIVSFVVFMGGLFGSVVINREIREVQRIKTEYTHRKEIMKESMDGVVTEYINASDKGAWERGRENPHLSEYAKDQLYGKKYESFEKRIIKAYKIKESKYTGGEDAYKVYVVLGIEEETGERRDAMFVFGIRGDKAESVAVY